MECPPQELQQQCLPPLILKLVRGCLNFRVSFVKKNKNLRLSFLIRSIEDVAAAFQEYMAAMQGITFSALSSLVPRGITFGQRSASAYPTATSDGGTARR